LRITDRVAGEAEIISDPSRAQRRAQPWSCPAERSDQFSSAQRRAAPGGPRAESQKASQSNTNGHHASTRDGVEEALEIRVGFGEAILPEVVSRVLDDLQEGDEEPPRVWTVHDQSFQQHPLQDRPRCADYTPRKPNNNNNNKEKIASKKNSYLVICSLMISLSPASAKR
jgi:hypothetical protein